MIRRDVQLADGSPGWALISQIEHARLSEQLAAHCVGRFSSPELSDVRREVLAAILLHDDGWVDWERAPRFDPQLGRPLSFMELNACDAIEIWTMSIVVAEDEGLLAAWMVAGHFARLADKSEHARQDAHAAEWRAAAQLAREECLASWQAIDPMRHTREVAEEALQWLWTFDEVSLWICCNCPVGGEVRPSANQTTRTGRNTPLEMELVATGAGVVDDPTRGLAAAKPWRFDAEAIDLQAATRIVPAVRYDNAPALFAASHPQTLRWRLAKKSPSLEGRG